jgi:hypothetical protein
MPTQKNRNIKTRKSKLKPIHIQKYKRPTKPTKPTKLTKPTKDDAKTEGLDEKGNPFPIEDPEGGSTPICPPGYKIDNDFDPFNDPINPLFRCIPDLKEPDDGLANSLMNEMNQSSNKAISIKNDSLPIPDDDDASSGGGRMTRVRMRTRRRRNRHKK